MNRPFVRLVLAAGGLPMILRFLHRAGDGLSGPLSPADPTLLVMAVLRSVALAAGWYLAAATVVGAAVRLIRVRPLVRAADRLTLPPLRRLLDASLGLSMAATVVASPAAWAEQLPREHEQTSVTMLRLPDDPGDNRSLRDPPMPEEPAPPSTTSTSAPPTTEPTTTTSVAAPTTTTTVTATSPRPRVEADAQPPSPPAPAGEAWTVRAGDHFWSIAREVLTRTWTRPPTDAETDPYWRTLVEANRHRLADPGNADLLFAGQVLGVPPPPAAPP